MRDEDFQGIMRGLGEAKAHARGERVPGLVVHVPPATDTAAIRKRTGLSQSAFARAIGVSPGTLKNWEQGRRQPEGPARVLLALLARNPRIVAEVLGAVEAPVQRAKTAKKAAKTAKARTKSDVARPSADILDLSSMRQKA